MAGSVDYALHLLGLASQHDGKRDHKINATSPTNTTSKYRFNIAKLTSDFDQIDVNINAVK